MQLGKRGDCSCRASELGYQVLHFGHIGRLGMHSEALGCCHADGMCAELERYALVEAKACQGPERSPCTSYSAGAVLQGCNGVTKHGSRASTAPVNLTVPAAMQIQPMTQEAYAPKPEALPSKLWATVSPGFRPWPALTFVEKIIFLGIHHKGGQLFAFIHSPF